MEIVELMIEGLRGYPVMTRIPFSQGLAMWSPLDGRDEIVATVLLDLLYPKGGDLPFPHLVDPNAANARGGLHLVGRDGSSFRLLRDYRTGKTSLLRQGTGGMQPVSSMPAEIGQMITAQIGFPQEDIFRDVFITLKEDLPSQQADALEISNPNAAAPPPQEAARPEESGKNRPAWNRPLPPGFEGMMSAGERYGSMTDDEKRARIAEIKTKLASFEDVKGLEFELDGLQKKGFAIDERLRPLDHLRRQLKEQQDRLSGLPDYSGVPEDLPQEQKRIAQLKVEIDAKLKDVDEKKAAYTAQLARELKNPQSKTELVTAAFRDPLILGGTAVGALGVLLGLLGAVTFDGLRWAAFLDIPGFGVALFGALRFIGDAEASVRIKRQIANLDKDRERIANQFDVAVSDFKATLKRHNLDGKDLGDVMAALKERASVVHAIASAQSALDEALAGDDLQTIVAEREALSARIKSVEEELYTKGGFMGNRAELEGEVKDLEDALAGRLAPPPEPVKEAPRPTPAAPASTGSLATARKLQRIVGHASDLLVTNLDSAMTALAPRAAQYLSGLADRRYGQMIFGPKGEVSVVDAATGRAMPFGMLTPGDRDIVYLALKLTVVEAAVRRARLPVLFHTAFETFPDVKDPLFVRMLQFLAGITQVMVMTRRPGIAAAGGQPVVLP